jgi:Na+-transporting methylmalonyl-CoA/oxaloacetate decarboxylase gamma subunit
MEMVSGESKKCLFCGKMIKVTDEICGFCGYNFKTKTQEPDFAKKASSDAQKKAKTAKIAGLLKSVGAIILLLVCLAVFIKVMGKNVVSSVTSALTPKSQSGAKTQGVKPAAKQQGSSTTSTKGPLPDLLKKVLPDKSAQVQQAKDQKKKNVLEIEGIFYDPRGRSFTTISGIVVGEGDALGSVTVHRINSDSVELNSDGVIRVLRVSESMPIPAQ